MKSIVKIGDTRSFEVLVKPEDSASFDSGTVHPVYATFALGRDAEWCCRLFVLDMKETDEEGIGTYLSVQHKSPALLSSTVLFIATAIRIDRNEIICSYQAKVGDRIIAEGEQGQKILKKEKLEKLFSNLSVSND
jgi:predicted thioesterase